MAKKLGNLVLKFINGAIHWFVIVKWSFKMNKFKLSMLAAVAASAVASAAVADGFYVSVGGGVAVPSKKFKIYDGNLGIDAVLDAKQKQKNRGMVQAEVGASYGDFRAGLELAYLPKQSYDITVNGTHFEGKLKNSFAMFVNGYYDVKTLSDMFHPYVTAGIGFAGNPYELKTTATTDLITTTKTIKRKSGAKFAWKVGLGSMINLNDNFALDVAYKYMDLGSVSEKNDGNIKILSGFKRTAHVFSGAVVYKF